VKIIIADSNELLRLGLRTTLQGHPNVEEFIEVENAEQLGQKSRKPETLL